MSTLSRKKRKESKLPLTREIRSIGTRGLDGKYESDVEAILADFETFGRNQYYSELYSMLNYDEEMRPDDPLTMKIVETINQERNKMYSTEILRDSFRMVKRIQDSLELEKKTIKEKLAKLEEET